MTDQAKHWATYDGEKIPESASLFPELFDLIKPESAILDVGCGNGKTAGELFQKGYRNLFGIDVNGPGVELARTLAAKHNVENPDRHFQIADAASLPFEASTFDCAITQAFWTSILVTERPAILSEIRRVLKPNGFLYAGIWAQTWDSEIYSDRYRRGEADGLEKGSFKVFDEKSQKLRYIAHHFSEEEIRALLQSCDLKVSKYRKDRAPTQSGNVIDYHVIIAVR